MPYYYAVFIGDRDAAAFLARLQGIEAKIYHARYIKTIVVDHAENAACFTGLAIPHIPGLALKPCSRSLPRTSQSGLKLLVVSFNQFSHFHLILTQLLTQLRVCASHDLNGQERCVLASVYGHSSYRHA